MKNLLLLVSLSLLISCSSKKDRSIAAYKEAEALYQSNDIAGSIEKLNKAIDISPDYTQAYATRAIMKAEIKDFQNALIDINKAIELAGKNGEYYYNRGLIRTSLLDYKNALQDFEKAANIHPKDFASWNNIGKTKFQLGDFIGAVNAYNKTIELNPKFAKAYFNKANAQNKLMLKDSACFYFEKALQVLSLIHI